MRMFRKKAAMEWNLVLLCTNQKILAVLRLMSPARINVCWHTMFECFLLTERNVV